MPKPLITQRNWRIAGGVILACGAAMAWYGVDFVRQGYPSWFLLAYFGVFLVLLLAAFYIVILDIRYIRLQYVLRQREIFRSTIGSEEFRRALREAETKDRQRQSTDCTD